MSRLKTRPASPEDDRGLRARAQREPASLEQGVLCVAYGAAPATSLAVRQKRAALTASVTGLKLDADWADPLSVQHPLGGAQWCLSAVARVEWRNYN
jgi:hypothetical protein